jgi:hypothetical protein
MTTPHPHDESAPPMPPHAPDTQAGADAGGTGAQDAEHTVMLKRSQLPTGPAPHQAPGDGTVTLTAQAPPPQTPGASTPPPPTPQVPTAVPPPQGPMGGAPPASASFPRTHLGHALASEWTKIRTVRSTMWTLGVMFALVIGIGFLVAVTTSSESTRFVTTPLLGGGLFGLMLGQICIITLGVLVVTSEYGTGMIRTTMTACPRRGRVLLAKALVFFVVAFVMTTAAASLTALIQAGMLGDMRILPGGYVAENLRDSVVDGHLVADGEEWLGATVGAGLYVALLGLLSLCVGAMLRHSAGAITTMLGVVLLPMLVAIFMQGESLRDVRDALMEYSPLNGLASLFGMPMMNSFDSGGWTLLGLLAAVCGVALGGAYAALAKRDV